MKYAFPLLAVVVLAFIAFVGSKIPGGQHLFGVVFPWIAMAIFVIGFCYRIVHWAKSPVPFKIPTTCGQQYSLSWIKQDKLESPSTTSQVVARMFLEIFLFRSLWRNTKAEVHDGPQLTYESSKWLWLFGILFHYSFLVIILRHIRLFVDPVPGLIKVLEFGDGILQLGAPTIYLTDLTILIGLLLLFGRRLVNRQVKYISLANDYFPLFLIFGIAVTGRYGNRGHIHRICADFCSCRHNLILQFLSFMVIDGTPSRRLPLSIDLRSTFALQDSSDCR